MRFNAGLTGNLTKQIISNRIRGKRRFTLVLMLEPTFACNLNCEGCGRIREYDKGALHLSLKECLDAQDISRARVVSICGGEPLLYPHISELINALIKRGSYIYLCTNGTLFADKVGGLRPHPNLMINFHIDGLEKTHDAIVGSPGTYKKVIDAIALAKGAGFFVCTNTTVYKRTDPDELRVLFEDLSRLGVDRFLISPAHQYSCVDEEIFLTKYETENLFKALEPEFRKYRFMNSPLYIEFLQGRRSLACSPWANPTRNTKGWRSPCYQMADAHFDTYERLQEETDWDAYGPQGGNARCKGCMVHCGFEPSAVLSRGSIVDMARLIKWTLS